jgi:hypothetical protein
VFEVAGMKETVTDAQHNLPRDEKIFMRSSLNQTRAHLLDAT